MLNKDLIKILIVSVGGVFLLYIFNYNIGLDLKDEGFVWYGTWRTSLGEIPMRDFISYDVGRYYWGAIWMWVFDNGIITFRFGNTILKVVAVIFGIMVLKKVINSWLIITLMAIILIVWMYHTDRAIGYCIAVMTVYIGSILIENPTSRMHLISGIFVGFSALVGRNYGLYTILIFFLLTLFIWHRFDRGPVLKRLTILCSGVIIGYSPLLIVMIVEPGFFDAFIQTLYLIIERGKTNIFMPIPWPWRYELSQLNWPDILKVCSIGGFFILISIVPLIVLIHLVRSLDRNDKKYAPLISAFVTSIVFSHYAFSRPDLTHLADGILPFLILVFIYPYFIKNAYGRLFSQLLSISVILMSLILSSVFIESFSKYFYPENYVKINIRGDQIWVKNQTARKISLFRDVVNKEVGEEESILFAPYLPGMYPILGRKSPVKTTYFLFPKEDQFKMIEKLENEKVNWAIISSTAIDYNKNLAFHNTHPILFNYIKENFISIPVKHFPKGYHLLVRENS